MDGEEETVEDKRDSTTSPQPEEETPKGEDNPDTEESITLDQAIATVTKLQNKTLQEDTLVEEEPQKPLTKAERKKKKKLEKKANREAAIRKEIDEELNRELNVIKKNTKEYDKKWKEICLGKATTEYKDWMMEQWNLFQQAIDKKDHLIEALQKAIEDADRQRVVRGYDQILLTDSMLFEYHTQVYSIKNEADSEIERLLKQQEFNNICLKCELGEKSDFMKTVLYSIQKQKTEKEFFWNGEFISKLDEEKTRNQGVLEELLGVLEQKLFRIWGEYKQTLTNYEKSTEKLFQKTEEIATRVRDEEIIMNNQVKKTAFLLTKIEKFNEQISLGEPMGDELKHLRKEKNTLNDTYLLEKKRMLNNEKNSNMYLSHLVAISNNVINDLERATNLGKKIIKHQEICKRLESYHEVMQPFPRDLQHGLHLKYTNSDCVNKMMKFWKRVGRADMTTDMLHLHRNKLRRENQLLKEQIKTVMYKEHLPTVLDDFKYSRKRF